MRRIGLLFVFVFGLYFDGTHFARIFPDADIAINLLMILAFFVLLKRSNLRTRKLMVYAVVAGFVGEYYFSIYCGMYTYRIETVPLYVPFAHAAVYARVFMFAKASIVTSHKSFVEKSLLVFMLGLSVFYLLCFNDVFGFLMTIGVLVLLFFRPKDRLFFLTMYLVVAVLEIGGTAFGAWTWPEIAFDKIEWLPSNNPPSGISLFYFLLDVGCFLIYALLNPKPWGRLKRLKKLNQLT